MSDKNKPKETLIFTVEDPDPKLNLPDEDPANNFLDHLTDDAGNSWAAYNQAVAECDTFKKNKTCDKCKKGDACYADRYKPIR